VAEGELGGVGGGGWGCTGWALGILVCIRFCREPDPMFVVRAAAWTNPSAYSPHPGYFSATPPSSHS
jgi:hypothetical protein